MVVVRFMETGAGRLLRIAAGLVLVGVGAWLGGAFWVLAAVGVLPIVTGALDVCLLAAVFSAPVRQRTHHV